VDIQSLNTKNIFSKIEEPLYLTKEKWEDIDYSICQNEAHILIEKANKAISLTDYLQSRYVLEHVPSSSGWSYKTYCPFHKSGNERTASFFINAQTNRYYCQACSASGGIVEFISRKFGRPNLFVAEFILKYINGKIIIESEEIKKSNEAKKFNEFLLKLSEIYNEFIKTHKDDDNAIDYIMKCMNGFDNLLDKNKEAVQKSIGPISEQIKLQLKNYNIKKGL
jgi:hypothetical protein